MPPFAAAAPAPAPAAAAAGAAAGAFSGGLSSRALGSSGFPSPPSSATTTLPPIRAATWSYQRATQGKCASWASGKAEHASATCAATTTSASDGLVRKLVVVDELPLLATRKVRSSRASLSTLSASSLMSLSVEWTLESQSAICARASLSVSSPSRAAFFSGAAAAWAIAKAAALGWSMTVVPSASVSENSSVPLPCGSKERSTPARDAVRRQALAARASLAESFILFFFGD